MSNSQPDTRVNREEFYNQSVSIINAHFDKELAKKSFFTPKHSIEHARNVELVKLEKQFFGRKLKE